MISIISLSWQMSLIMRHPFDSYVVSTLFCVKFVWSVFFCQWKRRRLPVAYDTNVPSGRLKLIPLIRCLSLRYQLKRQNRVLNKKFFVSYSRVQSCARKPCYMQLKVLFQKKRKTNWLHKKRILKIWARWGDFSHAWSSYVFSATWRVTIYMKS